MLITLLYSCENGTKTNQSAETFTPILKDTTKFPYKRLDKRLDVKDTTITVAYAATGCSCAQWALKHSSEYEYIYLEPKNTSIINADSLLDGEHLFQLSLKGRFYKVKGYPENYDPGKGAGEPARVLKYERIKILKKY
ncbi:hypothetical protein EOD41_01745 [Mucilaginibacter limnophilus]|uniref:Uncharacterized protein n=1 Tax=Mucilaginibacter limnophilus TaxID=1932778 RepID=A0A437MYF1_9SPHI|nr:hypothetical protein [Mucilaginibacter limnophilus]RVU02687.1 hypothetical protein EOD41_01745 [Mucilaginibacter limnophilus]